MSTHIFTSIAANYLPKARVLARSIRRFHPDFVLHLLLVDAPPPGFDLEREPFDRLIAISDLPLSNPEQWLFSHTLVEASTGLKGAALLRLLSIPGCRRVLYFDPDIVVLSPLDALLAEFERASILLTPHLSQPEESMEAIRDNEFSVLKHGVYNLGFLGVQRSEEGLAFARWWSNRLHQFCYDDIPNGIFTDQRWADLAPAAFAGVGILRDPVYNVATWNLTARYVSGSAPGLLTVGGRPLVFFHFSGFDSGAQLASLNKYGSQMPALRALRDWYVAELERAGQAELGSLSWVYSCFDNGAAIRKEHRRLYRDRVELQKAFPNPFSTADASRSFYHWLEAEASTPQVAPSVRSLELPGSATLPRIGAEAARSRVYLYVSGNRASNIATIESLRGNATARVEIVCIGSEDALAGLDCASLDAAPIPCGDPDVDMAFLAALRATDGRDMFFVKSGVLVPEHWDARLQWAAVRETAVATAAPLSAASETTRVLAEKANRAGLSQSAVDALDRFCYHNSQRTHPTVDELPCDLLFVNGKAAAEALALARPSGVHDFFCAASRLRWSHIVVDHIYVGAPPAGKSLTAAAPAAVLALREPARRLQNGLEHSSLAPIRKVARRRQLHICHNWGGGSHSFVANYAAADRDHDNYYLTAAGTPGVYGKELWLFRNFGDREPIGRWRLDPAIKATACYHSGYAAALSQIVEQHAIDVIVVSSFIGHSLDILRLPTRNVVVLHEYYPFCPALNISFEETCQTCSPERLASCSVRNPHHRFFHNAPPSYWQELRVEFPKAILASDTAVIAPSRHVREHIIRLVPELQDRVETVAHGVPELGSLPLRLKFDHDRLRLVLLGRLGVHKGQALLDRMLPELTRFCDLHLFGAGAEGARYYRTPGVTVVPGYQRDRLPALLADIDPDAGLLLSTVPETFSYTLHELFEMAVPPIATNIGSFAEKIVDGETGLLLEPSPESILARLERLRKDRSPLARIHARLRDVRVRRMPEMLQDYETVIGRPPVSAAAYFHHRNPSAGTAAPARNARLYWRDESAPFSKARSVVATYRVDAEPKTIRFELPPQKAAPAQLRCDPSDGPGFLLLYRMRLLAPEGECIWQWDARTGPFEGESESILPVVPSGVAVLLYCVGDAPAMHLPIPKAALHRVQNGAVLEMDVASPPAEQACESLAAQLLQANPGALSPRNANRILERLVNGSRRAPEEPQAQTAEQLELQLLHSRARVHELEASLSWRISAPLRALGRIWLALHARSTDAAERAMDRG